MVDLLARLQREGHRRVGLDGADAVNARDGGDDDDVVALEQRAGRRMAHPVDLLVDRRFLFDIGVGARDVGLGLVVIVVRNEIFDGIVGKEAPELAVELRRERLVGRQDEGGPLRLLDDLRHGERLARAGDAEQHLIALMRLKALDELPDRFGLIAFGLVFRDDPERAAAFGFVGAGRPVRRPRPRAAQVRVAEFEQRFQRLDRRRRAGHAARMIAPVVRRLKARLRRLRKALRLAEQSRIEQRRQMLVEAMNFRFGRLGAARSGRRFRGLGHGANMGGNALGGKGGRRATSGASAAACGGRGFQAIVGY